MTSDDAKYIFVVISPRKEVTVTSTKENEQDQTGKKRIRELIEEDSTIQEPVLKKPRKWYENRRGEDGIAIGASEAGQVTNCTSVSVNIDGPVEHFKKVTKELETQNYVDISNKYTEHGTTCEEGIRLDYEKVMQCSVKTYEKPVNHSEYPNYFRCQPDGLIERNGVSWILEIKAPMSIKPIPKQYIAQVMYQMWITGAPFCDYFAVKVDFNDKKTILERKLVRIWYCKSFIQWMEPRLWFMIQCLLDWKAYHKELSLLTDESARQKKQKEQQEKEEKYKKTWTELTKIKPPLKDIKKKSLTPWKTGILPY